MLPYIKQIKACKAKFHNYNLILSYLIYITLPCKSNKQHQSQLDNFQIKAYWIICNS